MAGKIPKRRKIKSAAQKREEKKRTLEKMKRLPFGCKVQVPGYRCAYRAWDLENIRRHIKCHRENIKSGDHRNKSRYYEIKIQNDIDVKKVQKKLVPKKQVQMNQVAIIDPTGKEYFIDEKLVFNTIDQLFEEKFVENVLHVETIHETDSYNPEKLGNIFLKDVTPTLEAIKIVRNIDLTQSGMEIATQQQQQTHGIINDSDENQCEHLRAGR